MARTLDECLHALSPSTLYKLAHCVELGKLCCVVGVVGRTGAQSVAQRNGNVILCADVADVVEVGIEETLLLMHLAPLGDDAAATAHDARQTCVGEVDVLQTDAAVDGEVVNSLLALLDECVAEYLPCQVFCLSVHLLKSLVHRHGAYRYGAVAQNPLACLVYVVACREVHQSVATPLAAPHCFLHLFVNARSDG